MTERGDQATLGERLKQLREDMDILQKSVAVQINKSAQAYSQYEGNKRAPDIDTLIRLADYYGVSVDYLLGRTKYKTPPSAARKKDNLYILYIGDLSSCGMAKARDYIDMLHKLEEK